MATKEQILARHGVDNTDAPSALCNFLEALRDPLAEGPLGPTAQKCAVETVDTDPLADADDPPHGDAANSAPSPEISMLAASPASDQAAEPLVTTPPPPPSVNAAQRNLVASQMRVARATDAQRVARGRVGLALAAFQRATMQTVTPDQLLRQHAQSEQQLRIDRAAGRIPPRGGQRRLGSAVDAYVFYTKASGRGAGGGRAFGRKAFPASMYGQTIPPKPKE